MGLPSLDGASNLSIERVNWSPEQRDLWYRIASHPFERGDETLDFTARLARDHGWSLAFARGAVAEYRRFCFLALVFDTPVTPSEEVDEVWHQHLTYSRDYWTIWCGPVLGAPLHHDPTAGGPAEQSRFRAQYAETLARYEAHFGRPDPAYWPGTVRRFRARPRYRVVDADRVWLVPRPRRPAWVGRSAGALALLLAAPRPAHALPLNPLDWTAQPFLTLYGTLAAAALLAVLTLRGLLRLGEPPRDAQALDVVELAYLAGGPERAADTVILGLVAAGAARYGTATERITVEHRGAPLPPSLEPFRAALPDGERRPAAIRALRPLLEPVRERLIVAGLSPSGGRLRTMAGATLILVLPVVALGLAKIVVGLERGKPVGILMVVTVTTALVGLATLLKRPVRTGGGDVVLDRYRTRHERAARAPRGSGDEILLALALGGTAVLAGTPYEAYGRAASSSGNGGGCGSGGDGGGGGGCGGCGGGGD